MASPGRLPGAYYPSQRRAPRRPIKPIGTSSIPGPLTHGLRGQALEQGRNRGVEVFGGGGHGEAPIHDPVQGADAPHAVAPFEVRLDAEGSREDAMASLTKDLEEGAVLELTGDLWGQLGLVQPCLNAVP